MNIRVEQIQGRVTVTLLCLEGDLDGSNYRSVIDQAKDLYQNGTRHLILDMSLVPYMSSSGIVALHTISLLMRGEPLPNPEDGWAALHHAAEATTQGKKNGKLLNLSPKVERTLDAVGMKDYFEIYTDLDEAMSSFI